MRRQVAAHVVVTRGRSADERWQEALTIRQEWLGHGLSTRPADRRAAEDGLTAIYARTARPRPRFVWVDSPAQPIPLIAGLPTLDRLYAWIRDPRGKPPPASDLAMVASQLRGALSAGVSHADPELSPVRRGKKEPWPELPPQAAFDAGVPLGVLLHQGIRVALHRSLARGFRVPVRGALAGAAGSVPACWYGQQDAAWVAYYDALHRLGPASYGPDALGHLGHWATLARSCGWWWPGEDMCVVVDRPEPVRTEPVPGTWHDEVRLRGDGIGYRDGWRPALT